MMTPTAIADVYKCSGNGGVPIYQEEPCPKGKELRNFQSNPPEITVLPAVRPCHSPIDSVAVQAGRRAMQRAFGREVLFTKEGGSGPEADLAEILDAPLVFIAVGLDSDRIHAPNESADISLLLRGAETSAYLWDELAAADLR